jgi:hypothetical protein
VQASHNPRQLLIPALLLVSLAGCIGEPQAPRPTERVDLDLRPEMDDLPAFEVEVPGISTPETVQAGEIPVADHALVIGVRVGTAERAYLIQAMEVDLSIPLNPTTGSPVTAGWDASDLSRHVINDVLEDTPVTVTYCDRTRCARVLTEPGQTGPLEVGVGGWNDGMRLLIDGDRMDQQSEDVPLEDVPFEVTTWKQWRERHPDTDIYVGG